MPEKWRIHHAKVNRVIVHLSQDLIEVSRFSLRRHCAQVYRFSVQDRLLPIHAAKCMSHGLR